MENTSSHIGWALPWTAIQITHLIFSQAKELYKDAHIVKGFGYNFLLPILLFGIDEGLEEKDNNFNLLDTSMQSYPSLQESRGKWFVKMCFLQLISMRLGEVMDHWSAGPWIWAFTTLNGLWHFITLFLFNSTLICKMPGLDRAPSSKIRG